MQNHPRGYVHLLKKLILALVVALLLAISLAYFLLPVFGVKLPICWPTIRFDCDKKSQAAQSSAASSAAPENTPASPETPAASQTDDELLAAMTLEEKVGQLFFVRCPEEDVLAETLALRPAGFILFGRDFEGETPESVRETIEGYQQASEIPLLIGVDEEGGSVVRVSRYEAFRRWPFQSPQELYDEGGMEAFIYDTAEKDDLLAGLGINVNLAPVCDVSTDEDDFIYDRTLGQDAEATAEAVRTTVSQMEKDGMGSVLKHFPGYGPNGDTHAQLITDTRGLDTYRTEDFLPFEAGIEAGADAVLVSHLIVSCMDETQPASLSAAVHEILRDELDFDGVVLTDDLAMDAITGFTGDADAAVLAIQAGNDLIISSDFPTQYQAVLDAVYDGTLTEAEIDQHVHRVLEWKRTLSLLDDAESTALTPEDSDDTDSAPDAGQEDAA